MRGRVAEGSGDSKHVAVFFWLNLNFISKCTKQLSLNLRL